MTKDETQTRYDNCIDLIRKTVWNFMSKANIPNTEFDEYFSRANLYFVMATKSYKRERAEFTTWLCIQITGRLLKQHTNDVRDWGKIEVVDSKWFESAKARHDPFSRIDWIAELTDDSKILIQLVQCGDIRLDRFLTRKANVRTSMRYVFRNLRGRGWSRKRIHHCFKNLREAFDYVLE